MLIKTATEIRRAADPSVPAARSRQGQEGGGVLGAEERSAGRPQRACAAAAEEAELAEEPEFSSGHGDGLAEQPQRGRRRRLHRALRAGGGGGGPQDREAVAAVELGVEVARLSQPEVAVKIRRLP